MWRFKVYIACIASPYRNICIGCGHANNLRSPLPILCWLQDLVGSAVVGVLICIRQMPAMEGRCQHFCVAPLPGPLQPGHVRGHVGGHVWGHVGQLPQIWTVEYDNVQKLADPWRSPAFQAAGVLSSSSVLSLRTDVGKDCQPSFIRNIHSNPKTLTFQSPSLGCNIQCWFSWLAIVCVPNCLWLHLRILPKNPVQAQAGQIFF